MSRVQEVLGPRAVLPAYFSGHDGRDGGPAHDSDRPHLSFAFDAASGRVLVVAPHVLERRDPDARERDRLGALSDALEGLHEVRAGRAGLLSLRRVPFDAESDPLVSAARSWRTITPYQVNRHAKKMLASEALALDVRLECLRRGLPEPQVVARDARGVTGVGLVGEIELHFARPVRGPLLLGRDRHLGGGLFVAVRSP